MRHTSFSFALQPDAEQQAALRRHVGAARFAYNQGLALLNAAYEKRKSDASVKVPYSGFDLINAFNRWKVSAEAGVNDDGRIGLTWRQEVLAQVFEESLADLGRAIKEFFATRKGESKGRKRGFPRFKKRDHGKASFRIRNKKTEVRVDAHHVRLPKLGELPVRESTRRLRRLLRETATGARAKICFATVSQRAGRWYVRINVEAPDLHPSERHAATAHASPPDPVGIDRGLNAFAVVARSDGTEILRAHAPKPLARKLRCLRRLSRRLSRAQKGGKNRQKQRVRLAALHARIAFIRKDFTNRLSTAVCKTHAHVAIEDLNIAGMVQNRHLARSIHDVAWGMFANQLRYKAAWRGCHLTVVDRFFPSSKACHRCQHVVGVLPLAQRTFVCPACHHSSDRDTNAAANCARFAEHIVSVVAKQAKTLNACGEEGAGRAAVGAVKPASMKQEGWLSHKDGCSTPGKGGVDYAIVNAL